GDDRHRPPAGAALRLDHTRVWIPGALNPDDAELEVDAYLLELLQQRTFKATDFYESPRGICRLLPPTTRLLAGTSQTWAQLVAPVAEDVARALAETPGSRVHRLSTPLPNSNRR